MNTYPMPFSSSAIGSTTPSAPRARRRMAIWAMSKSASTWMSHCTMFGRQARGTPEGDERVGAGDDGCGEECQPQFEVAARREHQVVAEGAVGNVVSVGARVVGGTVVVVVVPVVVVVARAGTASGFSDSAAYHSLAADRLENVMFSDADAVLPFRRQVGAGERQRRARWWASPTRHRRTGPASRRPGPRRTPRNSRVCRSSRCRRGRWRRWQRTRWRTSRCGGCA